MNRIARAAATATALLLSAGVATAAPAGASSIGDTQGCSHGYWKKHTKAWEEYTSKQELSTLFQFPSTLAKYKPSTMSQALTFGGGSGVDGAARTLLRDATASMLNAANEDVAYPYRRFSAPFGIVAQVNAALASGDRAKMLSLASTLEASNNLGCPLR